MATVAPITVDESTFESEVLNAEKPVLVDFWAAWCGPCRLVSPVVESIGDKHADKLSVAKVNTDDNQQLAMRYSIFSIPTLILFENGREAARLVGYMPQEVMEERLSQYLTWTLTGVMEEKSSRVVEVLLATVRPVQLLAGKLLGIGVVVFTQAAIFAVVAFGLEEAVGSNLLHGTAPRIVASALAWLVLGYAFYSWLYAAAGSLIERQDQVQSIAIPLALPTILGYVVALTTLSAGHASLFAEVLAYLPPTAPFMMPVLMAVGAAGWWQFAGSAAISLASTVGIAALASTVYRRAILRTGARVRLREVLGRSGS